mgnify:FL=1
MVNLSKTRNIISVILCAVIAVLTTLMLTAFTLQATFGNKSFVKKFLVTDNLVSQCEKELDENYTALEIKSGIPKRIFLSVEKDFSTKDSLNLAAENMFSNESSTLYSQERVDYFYKICTEYLDVKKISYNKSNVRNTARQAAEIYSNCVGMHNTDSVNAAIIEFSGSCSKVGFGAFLVALVAFGAILYVYRKKEQGYLYSVSGWLAGSGAVLLGSILCLILKVGSKFDFSPAVYSQCFYSMTKYFFAILAAVSAVTTALLIWAVFIIKKQANKSNIKVI